MKTITIDGTSTKMFKPHEAAKILGYHPRTVRRFIQAGTITAVDSNKAGVQPVWWITEQEIMRLKKEMVGGRVEILKNSKPDSKKPKPTIKKKIVKQKPKQKKKK